MTLLMKSYDLGPFILSRDTGEEVLPSRPLLALPGDEVKPDGTVVRSLHRGLVGIVDFRNRTSMGRSKAGVPLYLFHPVDTGYPPFIVGSKEKPDENWFCTAEFVSWVPGASWPRGAIQERLGPVGDAKTERLVLLAAATAATETHKKETTEGVGSHPDCSVYKKEPWAAVFHIDPAGCEDVDDVLAYKDNDDGSTTWLIGIADVAAWVPEGSPVDRQAFQRGQTLYENGTVMTPMLPHILSTFLASLRSDGSERPVIGLRLVVKDGACCVGGLGPHLGLHLVTVTQTFTYESVMGTDVGKKVAALSAALGSASGDSHVWIETVMVAYNAHVARRLQEAGRGILRRLPAGAPPYKALAAATGLAELEHLGGQAGEYCVASTEGDVSHAGLNLPLYCHASSPLRRYADLLNQRVLHSLLRPGVAFPAFVSPTHLNHRASVMRRTERDLWLLPFLSSASKGHETEGILLESSAEASGPVSIYCPAWRRVMKAKVEGTREPEAREPGSREPGSREPGSREPGSRGLLRVFVDRACPRLTRRYVCSFEAKTDAAAADAAAEPI